MDAPDKAGRAEAEADLSASSVFEESLPVYEAFARTERRTESISSSTTPSNLPIPFEAIDRIIPIGNDGRVDLHIREQLMDLYEHLEAGADVEKPLSTQNERLPTPETCPPKLNILMLVVGSRGDIQPFLALAIALKQFGHRVRLATHSDFRSFIENHSIEFFNIGGSPAELMAYMVKNPGLVPKFAALRQGEIPKRRHAMKEIIHACWHACYEPGSSHQERSGKTRFSKHGKAAMQKDPKPFVADAIIANPPSLAHIHCAEKLGIPLHVMFTMPWSPTTDIPQPLANIKTSNKHIGQVNFLSYLLVESIIWQGLGSIINRFRYNVLELDPIHPSKGSTILHSLRIPHTYCWSPSLLPKPTDWRSNISVTGYAFLNSTASYNPPLALQKFLCSGPPPIYVGFGSIVVEDSLSLKTLMIEAIRSTGNRVLLSTGWSSWGRPMDDLASRDEGTLVLQEDCPHDWLFPRVACVVHHGGAGTTAAGLKAGRSTVIVPFFGDQFFWGDMIHRAGAGPQPIPYRSLDKVSLVQAIRMALRPDVLRCAERIGERIKTEDGVEAAMHNFHSHLPLERMRCDLIPARAATWKSKSTGVRLSALAATVLRKEQVLEWRDLEFYRPVEHVVAYGPYEPVSGGVWAVAELLYDSFKGMGEILTEIGRVPVLGHRAWDRVRTNSQGKQVAAEGVSVEQATSEKAEIDSKKHKLPGEYMFTGTTRIGKAAARAPGAFSAAIAQGAHNMPHLWGDSTVRPAAKVTGVTSGVLSGCKELVLGVYDGISGLFVQPVSGLIDGGPIGFVKGAGKGIIGLPVKFIAAASGIVGYPLLGVDVAVSRALKTDGMKTVRNQRMLQGEHEYLEITEQLRREVVEGWITKLVK